MIELKTENKNLESAIFLYGAIIYALTIIAYFIPSIKFIYLVASCLLLFKLYDYCSKRISKQASVSILLAITIPISFRNIFGGYVGDLPIPWFYIIIMFIGIDALITTIKMKKIIKENWFVILLFVVLLIPYFNSVNKLEATKELLMLITVLVIFYWGNLHSNVIDITEYSIICNAYIYGIIFASLGIIAQYLFYNFFNLSIFHVRILQEGRVYLRFILGDMSGSTVYFATGVLMLLLLHKKFNYLFSAIIVVAMIFSTARAGLTALLITLFLFLITRKNTKKKWFIIIGFCVVGYILLAMMLKVRSNLSGVSGVLYSTGRLGIINQAFDLFKSHYIFGLGLDFESQLTNLNIRTVHNLFLMFLFQNGIIATVIAGFIFVKLLLKTLQTSIDQKWVMLVSIIGSCVSPSFLDMRFFTLLMLLVILVKPIINQNDNILSFIKIRKDKED